MALNAKRLSGGLTAVALLAACGGEGGSSATREQELEDYAAGFGANVEVDVDRDGETRTVTIQGPGGAQGGANLAVPAGFPEDVALYPNLNIVATAPLPGGGFTLQGHAAGAELAAVAQFYSEQMADEGWTDRSAAGAAPSMASLAFEKSGRTASVNLIAGQGVTVQIMVMPGG